MTEKQRIEKEAEQYLVGCSHSGTDANLKSLYIAGATAEHERMSEQLKEERNKAIDDCIHNIQEATDIDPIIIEILESLKK